MAKTEKNQAIDNANEAAPRVQRERKAALVLPTFTTKNMSEGDSVCIRVTSEMTTKPDIDHKTGKQKINNKTEQPALISVVNVEDLDTGEIGEMVVPIIMKNAFEKFEGKLAGECFELVKGKAESNKATKWEIYSIEA
jgi:hypothetical protein